MATPFTSVFATDHRPTGTLAVAVRTPDGNAFTESFDHSIAASQLEAQWPAVMNSFHRTEENGLAVNRIKFGGGNRELHCFKRTDGALLGILLPRNTTNETERDSELQRLAGEFESSAE